MTEGAAAVSPTSPPPTEEPDGAPRLAVLDVVRGVAILGILFMNVNDMGGSLVASFADPAHLGWSGTDRIAWWLREVLANGTARGLLEMLFGAGMVILTGRMAARAGEAAVTRLYVRRNLVLVGFGAAHMALLLWPGDILHVYGLAALVLLPLRRLSARRMLAIGLAFSLISGVDGGLRYFGTRSDLAAHTPAAAGRLADARAEQAENARAIAAEDAARGRSAVGWVRYQWGMAWKLVSGGNSLGTICEAVATMLIGAALFRWGVLQGGRSRRFYLVGLLAAYAAALPLRVLEANEGMDPTALAHVSWITSEFARVAMTAGHLLLLNWLVAGSIGARLLAQFRAAGQTALSLYLLQSLVGLWLLFPPWGLALYGRLGWASLMGVALAVDLVLLALANGWARRFRIGPVEWAWRSLVEGRALPLRRGAPA